MHARFARVTLTLAEWREQQLLDVTHPRCLQCRQRKQRSEYHQDSHSSTGLRAQCKECWNGERRKRAALARESALAISGGSP